MSLTKEQERFIQTIIDLKYAERYVQLFGLPTVQEVIAEMPSPVTDEEIVF